MSAATPISLTNMTAEKWTDQVNDNKHAKMVLEETISPQTYTKIYMGWVKAVSGRNSFPHGRAYLSIT